MWRGVVLGVALGLATSASAELAFIPTVTARYDAPTTRYDHGVLGDAIEWGALIITNAPCDGCAGTAVTITLPQSAVFEDTSPRVADMDYDGVAEVIVVESSIAQGARLAIYDIYGNLFAATPYIGQTHRWLAPIGAADFDGDGQIEVAYIDRPHLAKTLRVWRYSNGALTPVADLAGLTNHRIGEADIGGGLRDCDDIIEMITANADWTRVIATRLVAGALISRDVGPHTGRAAMTAAQSCGS